MDESGFNIGALEQPVVEHDARDLEFRVLTPDGRELRHLVKEGVTIGRSGVCDLVIDEPGVNLIHARVIWGTDGESDLMCVGRSAVELRDAPLEQTYFVDRLALAAGTRFWVGGVGVECAVVGSAREHRTPQFDRTQRGQAGRSNGPPMIAAFPRLALCPRCFLDLETVCAVARFCPKCGGALPERDAAGALVPPAQGSPLFGVYEALRAELTQKLIDAGEVEAAAADADPAVRSLIVLAYASALLNLGWRYEHGRGLWQNLGEAGRCYAKAGRLAGTQ
jgi:hypothetical protein